jgi:lysophospholipase L1-like esterase
MPWSYFLLVKNARHCLLFFLLLICHLGWGQALTQRPPIRVACVGNSITEGKRSTPGHTYPQQLQALLGPGYEVRNYGVGGRTLLKLGDHPYWKEAKYREALAWQPQVVIIKLGTNDSKPQNWAYKTYFEEDYVALIRSFKSLASHPKIYICQPTPAYPNTFDISPQVLTQEIAPLIPRIARKTHVKVIDLYTPLLGQAALCPDGIHPLDAGNALLAQTVYQRIK